MVIWDQFRLKDLKSATGNFHPRNKLGQGGFRTVYRGFLREMKKEVAVKKVSKDSSQGEQEFVAEVTTISSLRHKNLVGLIGWCCERSELLLVYEYLPRGSLDKLLFVNDGTEGTQAAELNWERRHRIICGVASALSYLHDGCNRRVLHRDVKSSNVMVESEWNARLGDFGPARTRDRRMGMGIGGEGMRMMRIGMGSAAGQYENEERGGRRKMTGQEKRRR